MKATQLSMCTRLAVACGAILAGIGLFAPQAIAAEPIVMGASISLTGRYAQTGLHFMRGYEVWQDQVNARGGILGRPIKFIFLDDKSDPTTGARLYEKLITHDKVDFVLGPYSSAVTFAVSTITEKYKQPMVAGGASSAEIWGRGYKYIFQLVTPGEKYLDGAIDLAEAKGLKRVAVINGDSIYPKTWSKAALQLLKDRKFEVVYHGEFPANVTDFSAEMLKIKAAKPDVLLCGTYFQDAVLIVRAMKELDVNVKILAQTVGPSLPQFPESLGADAEYVYGASQWEPIATLTYPGMAEMISSFEKKYGYQPTYQVAESYGSMQVLEQAIKNVGSIDREKIRDELSRLETVTTFGPYKVDKENRQIAHDALLIQIQKGKREVVWPFKVAPTKSIDMPTWKERGR